jgi:hypothetical protein
MRATTPSIRRQLERLAADAVGVGERLAFWAGVALPFIHVPVLAVGGLSAETMPVLVALWTAHALALLAGRRYSREGH